MRLLSRERNTAGAWLRAKMSLRYYEKIKIIKEQKGHARSLFSFICNFIFLAATIH